MHEQLDCVHRFQVLVYKYAKFLGQKPTLGMFVACDEDGNILEQPCDIMDTDKCRDCACREYQKALSRVIFDGFELDIASENVNAIKNEEKFRIAFTKTCVAILGKTINTLEDLTPYNLTVKFKI
jgi:hypothetical protein